MEGWVWNEIKFNGVNYIIFPMTKKNQYRLHYSNQQCNYKRETTILTTKPSRLLVYTSFLFKQCCEVMFKPIFI